MSSKRHSAVEEYILKLAQMPPNNYRRPAYHAHFVPVTLIPKGSGDTADLYPDGDKHDDGPPCGLAPPPGFPPLDSSAPRTTDARVTQEGNKWIASTEVPPEHHGFLKGMGGSTIKEIERDTRCRVLIPDRRTKSSTIKVDSTFGMENVSRCLDRIQATVLSRKPKKETTHMAAFPCTDYHIQKRFNTFKNMVISLRTSAHESCANPDLFPSELKLHLTICMLQLKTEEEKAKLVETVDMLQVKHRQSFPMDVDVYGLDIMRDDPRQAHVLFAKVEAEGLQQVADDMRKQFMKAGLLSSGFQDDGVKLHMTVMNSRYASKDKNGNEYRNYGHRTPFNVELLLEQHGDFKFGSFELRELTICDLKAEKNPQTGYYDIYLGRELGWQ